MRERDACGIGFVADRRARASHDVLALAAEALRRVRHRGAVAADERTGDGAGMLFAIPKTFFGDLGVGMTFLPPDREDEARSLVERSVRAEGLDVAGWRQVPCRPSALGEVARSRAPVIAQVLLADASDAESDRRAFRARKRIERRAAASGLDLYVASMSFATITYKALCAADQLAAFFPDLADPRFQSSFALFHQRYSTNTTPSWERAQPFHLLCHNGEINSIRGNVQAMRAREYDLGLHGLGDADLLTPVIDAAGSDSSMLDNAVELLVRGGRGLDHVLAMLIPQAWESDAGLDPSVRDFYRYHACLAEPWDGPAAIVASEGRTVVARLDRNGLRPLRFVECSDGLLVCASEAGVVDVAGRGIVRRGRLGPGGSLVLDLATGEVTSGGVAMERIARCRPYGQWTSSRLTERDAGEPGAEIPPNLLRLQIAFGYTREELTSVIRPMAANGLEPTSSMGDDTAQPPLANRPRPVFGYLKQRFAQVTNPPIDPLYERLVMSLATRLGPRGPIGGECPEAAALVVLPSFFLYPGRLGELRRGPWPVAELDASFAVGSGADGLATVCGELARRATSAVGSGAGLLVLTDAAVDETRAPIPSVLAVGAVHQALVRAGLRPRVSIVADSGEAREVHHFACLLGYGADAVLPRVALATIAELFREGRLGGGAVAVEEALESFRGAIERGVLKVMSKMGVSTLDSYRGAQIFEAIGLGQDVIELCLSGTPSALGGRGLAALGEDVLELHAQAFATRPSLVHPGFVKHRTGAEYHATNPDVVAALHAAVGLAEHEGNGSAARADAYRRFAKLVNGRPASEPRDLLELRAAGPALSVEEVEPVGAILRRFSSGAMSHGALSAEAHETLALGLSLVGARANTGEGGEDFSRYRDGRNSPIKQIASARFGVTPEYCAFAEELQIKMAQGSKPGEGGQLPAHKVTPEIAALRHTPASVTLISPPPHHDIYSIEDLAQLIYDLKQVNPRARVSVKLVSSIGVGVIAAGVVKGLADVVHIAGADGGTGASPLSSIKNAGLPWEVGLAETQAALVDSGLRGRVRLRVDGGLKTGRDVLVAALLGADEFSFGTAALLALGCIMVRACHRDTCPTGIATQRPDLRAKFAGAPEHLAAYLTSVADEVRALLAWLGLGSVEEAVGRLDLLRPKPIEPCGSLDVSPLLREVSPGPRRFVQREAIQDPSSALGDRLTKDALPMLRAGERGHLWYRIGNGDRAVGARLGGELAMRYGSAPPPGRVRVDFVGSAGQSFGAFLGAGIELRLVGDANDYVGKAMAGGCIAVSPPADDAGDPVLVGNTVLYGATGGELFCAGQAGERFAVRNSGAVAVVEGTGDHACEYMTGGTVLVLGPVGWNLGAGMSGGTCIVWDEDAQVEDMVNQALVELGRPCASELDRIRELVQRHLTLTGSPRAAAILRDWDATSRSFLRIAPRHRPPAAQDEPDDSA